MRCLVLVVALLFAGCITEETKLLVQGIHLYQVKQVEQLKKWDQLSVEEKEKVIEDAEALARSTQALMYIVGEPEIIE